jgi:uncharacterized protein YrzB (UPF0473 family)
VEKLMFTNESGEEVECEVLGFYDSEKTKKSYVIYTDDLSDSKSKDVYVSETIKQGDEVILKDITDEVDKLIIKKIIESLGGK